MGSYVCWAWIHESQVQCSYLRHSTNLGFFSEIKMDYKLSFFKKNHILIFPLEGKTWFSDFRNGETKSETQFFLEILVQIHLVTMAAVVQTLMEME